eukprot:TRINITY_DN24138_c0_g2_i1.p1 TRINITY_DN24138_c0_g2~~TRINITY_DN24138_c0_g2_i1.p1  ORF type:complete len:521 (+),score=84.56 TRINITY_DN24138_c0_g2_i1:113-1675(+)
MAGVAWTTIAGLLIFASVASPGAASTPLVRRERAVIVSHDALIENTDVTHAAKKDKTHESRAVTIAMPGVMAELGPGTSEVVESQKPQKRKHSNHEQQSEKMKLDRHQFHAGGLDHLYKACGSSPSDLIEQMQVYTIDRGSSGHKTADKKLCLRKADLDSEPTSSFVLLTMADTRFFAHVKQLLRSALLVPQKGGLPKKIVVVDGGMGDEEVAELKSLVKGVPFEIDDVKDQLKRMKNTHGMKGIPDELPYTGDGVGGAAYRVKVLATTRWLNRLSKEGADQLVVLDAGGIILSSLHRVRNFAASEGFYAGLTGISVLSALVANSGLAPESIRQERIQHMKVKGVLPKCFDYERDFLIDETKLEINTSYQEMTRQLDTFEGGFLVLDGRFQWVKNFARGWEAAMSADESWGDNQAYYFPHDQKVLANEVWKSLLCGDETHRIHLLDTNNIRFGSVAQNPDGQPHKGRRAYAPVEKVPWSGYSYHYCMKQEYVPHICMNPLSYNATGWEQFATSLKSPEDD